jgi:hypothetical protein
MPIWGPDPTPIDIERWGLDEKMNMPAEYDFNGVKARLEEELEHWERGRVA